MDFQSIWMLSKICFNIWVMKAIWSFGQWCQWWLLRQHPDPAKTMIGAPTDGRTFKTCSKDTRFYLILLLLILLDNDWQYKLLVLTKNWKEKVMIKESRPQARTILMATSGQGRDDWGLTQSSHTFASFQWRLFALLDDSSFCIREGKSKLILPSQNNSPL